MTTMTTPLISCLMATSGRARLAAQTLRYWQRQTWPNRELVIIAPPGDWWRLVSLTLDEHFAGGITWVPTEEGTTQGARYNLGMQNARAGAGDFVAFFDDDDWHAPTRLFDQALACASGGFDLVQWTRFYALHWPEMKAHEMPRGDVAGGTWMMRREAFEPFDPLVKVSTDRAWWEPRRERLRVGNLDGRKSFVYVLHRRNVSGNRHGRKVTTQIATAQALEVLGPDADFYRELAEVVPRTGETTSIAFRPTSNFPPGSRRGLR